ncbi:kinase-like domain-containing protein [Rhizophagus clarus]|uniref:Kinase-like domain-containing protein n=1 Tax=Rhizophagus clarus TaxID=94130 RepID=A0A8H3QUJ6_9GLOM|nr:kinase-like domain-containing protein [Rhizophagus clarus]
MSRLGKSDSEVVNKFISRNKLRWIPYDKFENVRYFDEGGFGIIYRAGWLYKNGNREVVLKCFNRLNNLHNDLDKFLNEWKYRGKCFKSLGVIDLYGFTKDPNTSKYMLPSSKEIRSTIKNWIFRYEEEDDDDDYIIDEEELKRDIEEFINTPQIIRNNLPTEPHPQASYTSRSHNFTSKSLNEILESKRSHVIIVDEIEEEECFDDLMIWQYKLIRCVIYNFL